MHGVARAASLISAAAVLAVATAADAATRTEKIAYAIGDAKFEGVLVWDDAVSGKRPAVLMAPDYMGVSKNAIDTAATLAGTSYVIFVADMYSAGVRPGNAKEAGAASGGVKKDLMVERARINRAFDVMIEEGGKRGLVDPAKTAAIGFCFGGGNVLELARSGRDTKAVVSFHGTLTTRRPEDAKNIRASVLVLHGEADPVAPEADRVAFEKEMRSARVKDWQMVVFGGAVHSFTNPNAKAVGRSMYDPKVAKRAFGMMNDLFAEVF